jgi:hypothetical protein
MRVQSELWIKAYVRAVQSRGDFAAVVHRGDEHRGVVYIKLNRLDGTATLFGPAPPSLDAPRDGSDGERAFVRMHAPEALPERDIDQLATRAREFDPDIWIVETESREGRHGLDDWLATQS